MIPADWIPHTRGGDGEILGWIRMEGDDFVPVDRLGRDVGHAVAWDEAEETLERLGLSWLAEPWMLDLDGSGPRQVRIVEVRPDAVLVKQEDYGDIGFSPERRTLPFPAPEALVMRDPAFRERLLG